MSNANEPDPVSNANEPDPVSNANEPDPVSNANEPDPVSNANEPDPVGDDAPRLRMEVTRGGDPGPAVLAAVAAVLTRPVVRSVPVELDVDPGPLATSTRWQRAARLESVVHGRRIHSAAELVRHR